LGSALKRPNFDVDLERDEAERRGDFGIEGCAPAFFITKTHSNGAG
jgi:hypothetical protein